jgi:hypothetical protein
MISITIGGLVWQGYQPTAEVESMRSQVLRRIGYPSIADGIESGITSPIGKQESDGKR